MRVQVLVDARGQIVGTARASGHAGMGAALTAGPGQQLHTVEAPDELGRLPPAELHQRLRPHLPAPRHAAQ
jgi:hypothetical protein